MEERISILLNLGNGCNMNCSYCYQDKRTGTNKMSIETLDNIITRIKQTEYPIQLAFFGGEPTMYVEEILYLIEKLEGQDVVFSMSTNGLKAELITDINNAIKDSDLSIMLSNKGFEHELDDDVHSAFRFVLTPFNIRELNLAKLVIEGYEQIEICFDYTSDWSEVNEYKFEEVVRELAFISSSYENIIMKLPYGNCENDNSVLCGYSMSLPIDHNGDLLVCQRTFNSTKKDVLGNIADQTIEELLNTKNAFALQETENGYCYWNQLNENEDRIKVLASKVKPLIDKYKERNYIPERILVSAYRCD